MLAREFLDDDALSEWLRNTFGEEIFKIAKEDEWILKTLRYNKDFLGFKKTKIVLVGTTFTGKTSILNVLFGARIGMVKHHPDVTGEISKIVLPSGLIIYDTPGVGGINDKYETITRAFLGLRQLPNRESIYMIPLRTISWEGQKREQTPKEMLKSIIESYCEIEVGNKESKDIDVVIFVFDLAGGHKRADKEFLEELKSTGKKLIVVGNKKDLVRASRLNPVVTYAKEQLDKDIIVIAADPRRGKPQNINQLVSRFFYVLSERATWMFNEELVVYKHTRNDLIHAFITKMAAKAAVIRVDKKAHGIKIPELQALMMGIMLRLSIDYSIGGPKVKQIVSQQVMKVYEEIHTKRIVTRTRTRRKKIEEEIQVPRVREDQTLEGIGVGATVGGLVGAIFGPIGIAAGGVLGGIAGGIVGNRISGPDFVKRVVTKVIEIPYFETTILKGGLEAALGIRSFGYTLWKTLEYASKSEKRFEPNFFEKILHDEIKNKKYINTNLKALDQMEKWQDAYDLLISSGL